MPTLILHGRDEQRIPFGQGIQLASLIKDSRLVPLDTQNHLLRPDEPAWGHLLEEVDAFLAEDEPTGGPRSVHPVTKSAGP